MKWYLEPMLAPDQGATESEVDDVEIDDIDDDDDEEGEDLEDLVQEDDDDSSDDEEGDDKPDEEEPPAQQEPAPKTFTQEDVDRIINDRLARERRNQEERAAASNEQQRAGEAVRNWQNDRYNEEFKRFTDFGYDDETATAMAQREVQRDTELLRMKVELEERKLGEQQMQKVNQYAQHRADYLARIPMAAKFVDQIDSFSQGGMLLDFDVAANQILGEKIASGELLDLIKTSTEQRTLANVGKRQRTKVEGSGLPGSGGQVSLSRQERQLAKAFGLTAKEWAESKAKTAKTRKRG